MKARTRRGALWGTLAMMIAISGLVAIGATPAHAAFPGRDGLIVFQSDRDGRPEIYTMEYLGGTSQTRLTDNPGGSSQPSWSADGNKIVFSSGRDGNAEIYVMEANGENQIRLTDRPSDADTAPTFSPDGTKIAFVSSNGGTSDIWVMGSDGSNPVDITNDPADDLAPSWSPDGTKIAFETTRTGNHEIFVMNADGGSPTNLTNTGGFEATPDWSPDGTRIAYASNGLRTMLADGSNQALVSGSAGVDTAPSWGASGEDLVFTTMRDFNAEIYRLPIDGSYAPQRLTDNAPPGTLVPADTAPDWQPRATDSYDPLGEYNAQPPHRIVDTRIGTGGRLGKLGPGQTMQVQINDDGYLPPTGVGAVVINATATEPTAASYLTLWPSGFRRPTPSNLNFVPGQTVANLVTVAVSEGKVSVYNNAGSVHVVLDVVGFYYDSTGQMGARFHAVTPTRLFDTRSGLGGVLATPMRSGQTGAFKVTGKGGVPEDVNAVVLNVTVTQPTSSGFLTVYPFDVANLPVASNINFVAGQTVPNLVVVRAPSYGLINFYNYTNFGGTTHVLADVVGYFDADRSTEAGRLLTLQPTRLVDTRIKPGSCLPGGYYAPLTFPSSLGAVVVNTTVTEPTAPGHMTVFPYPPPPPLASNLNFVPGQTVPNLVMVKVGDGGKVGFYNSAGCTHLVIDLFGFFTGPGTSATADAAGPPVSLGDVDVGEFEAG
jgi:hypothetical protein